MKVPNNSIENWLNTPPDNVFAVLIYGPDVGLVSSRAAQLEKGLAKKEELDISQYDLKRLKDEPYLLNDAMQSLSLLGGKPVIKIKDSSSQLPKHIQESLSSAPGNGAFIIWCAEELSPSSSLRKFFEKEKNIAAIPCYKDDEQHIQLLISRTLNQHQYRYDGNVPLALAQKFYGDRLIILSELDKLMLYTQESKNITIEDVEACIQDSQEISLNGICNAIADRDVVNVHRYLHSALSEGMTAVAIIRVLAQYFMKLHYVKNLIEEGASFQDAAKKIKPPIFFKQLPVFQRHIHNWSNKNLQQILI
jgi:DNA polymerase-3 subunit delta